MEKLKEKLEGVLEKTVDFVAEHPVKSFIVFFVTLKVIKWIKE